jgi:hypothetical protein
MTPRHPGFASMAQGTIAELSQIAALTIVTQQPPPS